MLDKSINASLRTPVLIVILFLSIVFAGVYKYQKMPVDAFPDISPIMVPIFSEGHGMAPEEMERLVTYPIESAMNGLPNVSLVKSTSAFGMSVVYVYFSDDTDIYFARQLVAERLSSVSSELPEMETPPALGPISTGLGQIFIYYLTADPNVVDTEGKELSIWLRELNDWVIKYQLQTVPGVTDVLSMGGHVLQYQVQLNPQELSRYNIPLEEVVAAIRDNNRNVGGQFLTINQEEHLVRGIGLLQSLNDIRNLSVKTHAGNVVYLKDIAQIHYGKEIRRGVVTRNGEEEVVSGIVMKLYGENTSKVITNLYDKVDTLKKNLPAGVKLVPYYEQANLVDQATATVEHSLLKGGLLVIAMLFLFLWNWRTAAIVAISLPVCAFISILCMGYQNISANLMSLGGIAIAIGMLGDGSIVIVENIYRHLTEASPDIDKREVIYRATTQVSRPILFSIAIIILVFLPVFSLEGVEGKMFSPMAFSIVFALIGSILTALFLSPVLALFFVKQKQSKTPWLVTLLTKIYKPLLELCYRFRKTVILLTILSLGFSLSMFKNIGKEFMPVLEEGSILISLSMAPSISLEEGTKTVMRIEKMLLTFDEVEETISRIGRPEAGSHPHPVNTAEIQLNLAPDYGNKQELIKKIREKLTLFPGSQAHFTQPIQNAFDELLAGVKTQLAIKIYGEDLQVLRSKSEEVKTLVEGIDGLVDVSTEQNFGQPQIQVQVDRQACARYGVSASEVMEMVELAVGGEGIDQIYLNNRRFAIHLRYQESFRSDIDSIKEMLLATDSKEMIPLKYVANVKSHTGPIQIQREKNQRRWTVQGNIEDRDIGGVVDEIQTILAENLELPTGYFIEYGGQFENQQRAMKRLSMIVPFVVIAILMMLWLSFGSVRNALVILINVPLVTIGGFAGLLIMGEYLSVPASVGFIALFGIAVQNGMVLVSYFNDLRQEGKDIKHAVIEGSLLRLRPVLMTACTTMLGLLPLLMATGSGSEVQRPLAAVVVFGLAISTLFTLFIIPVSYGLVENLFEKK